MRYLYTLLLFIAVNTAFAQTDLHVSNNAATYIYVDGAGFNDAVANVAPIYVANGINLAGTDSKIYLRNEAQLLQGNDVGNSGDGDLSVQQQGTVNRWVYNYWCSPVGNPSAAVGNEAFRAELIDESTGLISSVNAGFTSGYDGSTSPLTISNRWIYTFSLGTVYNDWNYVSHINDIAPGLGFTMKGTSGNPIVGQLYDFRGKPNNGTIANRINDGEFTLIGNPYPSAIDAQLLIHDPQNTGIADGVPATTTGVLLYWEQDPTIASHVLSDYIGGYALYTISSGGTESFIPAQFATYDGAGNVINIPPGPPGGTKTARRYIPIGQGFMVEGETGIPANANVYLINSMRVFYKQSGLDSYFFRNSDAEVVAAFDQSQYNDQGLNIVPENFKRFRINIDFDDTHTRQLLHNFTPEATEGFDYGLEAKNTGLAPADAHWVINDTPFHIQALVFDESLQIPITVIVDTPQSVRFRIFDVQNFEASQPIYLHDIENNIYVDLRTQNYDINLPLGSFSNRFEITFTTQTLNTPEVTAADFTIFQNNPKGQLTILNPNGLHVKSVRMFDTAGKQIFDTRNLNTESEYHFSTKSLSEGIYVASITLGDNQIVSKKVIVKTK